MYSKKLEGEVWDVYSEDLGIDCEYDEYLAGLAKGEFVNTYINKAYQLVEPSLMCDIISELRKIITITISLLPKHLYLQTVILYTQWKIT